MASGISAEQRKGLTFVGLIRPLSNTRSAKQFDPNRQPLRRRRRPTTTACTAIQKQDTLFHTFYEPRSPDLTNKSAIFIHDFLTDSRMFEPLIGTSELHPYTLLSYDMRGFGRSPDPHAPYSRSEDIHALFPHPAHIVGSGLGGSVALEYALSHPDFVSSVTVISSGLPGHRWSQEAFLDISQARTAGRFLGAGAHLQGYEKDLVHWKQMFIASNKTWNVLRDGNRDVAKGLIEMARAYRGFHFFNEDPLIPHPMETPPLIDRLNRVNVPVKVMVGDNDTKDFREIAKEICMGAGSDADVLALESTGHFAVMERPAAVAQELVDFWEKVSDA